MTGRGLLGFAAKVQGEPETVVGKVTFKPPRWCHVWAIRRDPCRGGCDSERGGRPLVRPPARGRIGACAPERRHCGRTENPLLPRSERGGQLFGHPQAGCQRSRLPPRL